MDSRLRPLIASLFLFTACDKLTGGDEGKAEEGKAEEGKAEEGKAEEGKAEEGKAEEGGDSGDAGGQEIVHGDYPDAIRDCPKELSGRVDKDRLITKECGTITVSGTLQVDGASLILQEGATLAFKDGAELRVGYTAPGKLIVEASKEQPVTFTSAGDKAPGVWRGVRLESKSDRSSIDGLVVEYGGDNRGAVEVKAPDITFKNSTIRHTKDAAAVADSNEARFAEFSGNTFENIQKVAMRVSPLAAGDVAADNTFPEGSEVHINGSRLQESATWHAISVPFVIIREVRVEGKDATRAWLDIEAGTHLMADADGALTVGYTAEGGLRVKGEEGKPVVFEAHERKEAGAWRGLNLQSKGEIEIAHAELKHGGKRDKDGALHLARGSRARIENVSFIDNAVGVVIAAAETEVDAFSNNKFTGTPLAVHTDPARLGSLGDGNTYEGDARIVVKGGSVKGDMNVTLQPGAKVELEGTLRIDEGKTSIPAGFELHIQDAGRIQVGYIGIATLELNGAADKPIKLVGQRDEPGSWKNLTFHGKAKGNVVEHVVVRNAGAPAGVVFERESGGKVDGLSCEKCEVAALDRHKDAKVEVGEVKAADGTPSAETQ